MKIYSLDIGGSSIKHGLIDINYRSCAIVSKSTSTLESNHFSDLKELVFRILTEVLKNSDINAIAISTTGSVDTNGVVINAGHFDKYTNISWEALIKKEFKNIKYVLTVNDGRASTWAEYNSNSYKSGSHIHYVVGTGIGGGIVVNNKLLLGDNGLAGYLGHLKITDEETIKCSCGKFGCVETLASTRGMIGYYKKLNVLEDEISFDRLLAFAKEENEKANLSIKKGGFSLGIGIGNCMNIINPSNVSIGGGVIIAIENLKGDEKNIYFDSIIEGIECASHKRILSSCHIRKAHYGNDGGMIGAAQLCSILFS